MPHLDEGTIHAWLDGALPDDEAARVEAHVRECAACADAVAEARGFIAAASRILSALDDVPAGVVPATSAEGETESRTPESPARAPLGVERGGGAGSTARSRRWLRGPAYAAAAVLVLAVGSTLVLRRNGEPSRVTSVFEDRASPPAPTTAAVPGPVVALSPDSVVATAAPDAKDARLTVGPLAARADAPPSRRVGADVAESKALGARLDAAMDRVSNEVALQRKSAQLAVAEREVRDSVTPIRATGKLAAVDLIGPRADSVGRQRAAAFARIDTSSRARLADSVRVAASGGVAGDAPRPAAPQRVAKQAAEPTAFAPASVSALDTTLRVVSGRVTIASSGAPLREASVIAPGQTAPARTDARGEFTLRVPRREVMLRVLAIGYTPQALRVPLDRDTVMVALQPSTVALSEVVVTGATGGAERRAMESGATAERAAAIAGCFDLDFSRYRDQLAVPARESLRRVPARFRLDTARVLSAQGGRYRALELRDPLGGRGTAGVWQVRGDVVEIVWSDAGAGSTRIEIATRSTPMLVTVFDSASAAPGRPVATARQSVCSPR